MVTITSRPVPENDVVLGGNGTTPSTVKRGTTAISGGKGDDLNLRRMRAMCHPGNDGDEHH